MDIVYKVVSQAPYQSNTYYSAIVRSDGLVEYTIGIWTCAPKWLAKQGYHLIAFDAKWDAITFLENNMATYEPLAILKCQAKNKVELLPYMDVFGIGAGKLETSFFEDEVFPPGTVMYKQLRPTELITDYLPKLI